jgi:hypothetical protein
VASFDRKFAIGIRWIVFFLLMNLIAAIGFSAMMMGDIRPSERSLGRFLAGFCYMFAVALVSSPFTASTAGLCWVPSWSVLQWLRTPERLKAMIAGAFAGLGTILPVMYMFSGDSIHHEAYQRTLIVPLLWCVPLSGALSATIIYSSALSSSLAKTAKR